MAVIEFVIDEVKYHLKEYQDLSWLRHHGTVFMVIDETGSGCINFGIEKDSKRYFYKIAGVKTIASEVSEQESIRLLKEAATKYKDIHHEHLIKYVDSFDYNEFFVVVYEYAEGECLFDHWNFDRYKKTNELTPMMKFKKLPIEKRISVVDKLFSFFETVIRSGYVAVDFYDSSIIYDFENDNVTFCDIDLFRKTPTFNDLGEEYFGTKRLKAPEENELGAVIDECTNIFTLGAIIFDMFSEVSNKKGRYEKGVFVHNSYNSFELSKDVYDVLMKATYYDRDKRYHSIIEFYQEFNKAIKKMEGI